MATRQISPMTPVWFLTGNGKERLAAQVEGRQGGAYRIAYGDNQTRIVNRNQMVIRRPRSC